MIEIRCNPCSHQWQKNEISSKACCPQCGSDDLVYKGAPGKTLKIVPPESTEEDFESLGKSSLALPPHLRITVEITKGFHKGRVYELNKARTSFGRNKEDIDLEDMQSSRRHMVIEIHGDEYVALKDMASANGTYLNGRRVSQARLSDGDLVKIGGTEFRIGIENRS